MAFYFPVRLNFAAKSIKVSDMDVITMESKAYKELDNKITAIADYIFNRLEAEKPNEDDMWVDSYEVCTFLKISEKTLQRLRVSGTSFSAVNTHTAVQAHAAASSFFFLRKLRISAALLSAFSRSVFFAAGRSLNTWLISA